MRSKQVPRTWPAIALVLVTASGVIGWGQSPASRAPQPEATKAAAPCEQANSGGVDQPIDARLFVQAFRIDEIRSEFPIKAGMTVAAVEAVAKQQDSLTFDKELHEIYNLGWEKRNIQGGDGWIYFWVNGKHLLHCDLVIEKGRVKSVWVTPGNDEWVGLIYYRLSGAGQHETEGRTATDPSRISSDEQLMAIKTPAEIDRLSLHSSRVTDEGMKRLPAFANLRKLGFGHTAVSERGLQHLEKLTHLRELDLGGVGLTDRGLAHIAKLERPNFANCRLPIVRASLTVPSRF